MLLTGAGLVIILAAALFVAFPLLRSQKAPLGSDSADAEAELWRRRDLIYREIADLDFDHRLGKVEDADYRLRRHECLEAAAEVLQELDQRRASVAELSPGSAPQDDELELEIRRRRGRRES